MTAHRPAGSWLTVDECARRVGVSRQAVHKRIKAGALTAWSVGPKETVVLAEDVARWVEERDA